MAGEGFGLLFVAMTLLIGFIYSQKRHVERSESVAKELAGWLEVSWGLGIITVFLLLAVYFTKVEWYWPILLFLAAAVAAGLVFAYLASRIGLHTLSLVAFVGWPVAALWVFGLVNSIGEPYLGPPNDEPVHQATAPLSAPISEAPQGETVSVPNEVPNATPALVEPTGANGSPTVRFGTPVFGAGPDPMNRGLGSPEFFSPSDTIYLSIPSDSPQSKDGTLSVKWSYLFFVQNDSSVLPVHTESRELRFHGPGVTIFSLSKADGWPAGLYFVELSLNGNHFRTMTFTVQ